MVLPWHATLVRSHLEYSIHFGVLHVKEDVDKLGRVQQRATEMIREKMGRTGIIQYGEEKTGGGG